MNFDRFNFKAISKHDGEWKFATLNFIGDSCSVRWQHEWEKSSYTHSGWIVPETLCQCTGLKDSDGKLIYENDILEVEMLDENETGVVYYQELEPSFRVWLPLYTTTIPALMSLVELSGRKVRVIGNKFDKEGKNA